MAEITASLVKELRDKTSAGMMDCKEALKETSGDIDAAIDYLRKKGIDKAGKKASRDASEGIVQTLVAADGRSGTIAEINCETDFVAKNDSFTGFVDDVIGHLDGSSADTVEAAMAEPFAAGEGSLEDSIKLKIIELGENLVLRRFGRCAIADGSQGVVSSYIHMAGKVGVLIEVGCEKAETVSSEGFQELVKDLTLHIAASDPLGISRDDIAADKIAAEQSVHEEQMKADPKMEGKPEQALAAILQGKMNKLFFATVSLLDQGFVKAPEHTIAGLLETKGKELGDTIVVRSFIRYAVGS